MSFKKKLFFSLDGVIKSEEKIIKLELKTGGTVDEKTDEELLYEIILRNFIKSRIYPSCIVINSIPDMLYFEQEEICKVLRNNETIKKLSSPKNLFNSINNLLIDIDEYIYIVVCYIPKVMILEEKIINFIEYLRENDDSDWYYIFRKLKNVKNVTNNLCKSLYDDLLELFNTARNLKYELFIKNCNIFQIIYNYDKLVKRFSELNKSIDLPNNKYLKKKDKNNKYKIEDVYDHLHYEYAFYMYHYNIELNN